MFPVERLKTLGVLIDYLHGTSHWDMRYDIEWYIDRCLAAGVITTEDQIRLAAGRYIAGKRKVSAPGTKRKKRAAIRRRKILANTPRELLTAVDDAMGEHPKAITQYLSGVDKALNAVVGSVMKRHRSDPAVIRELILSKMPARSIA